MAIVKKKGRSGPVAKLTVEQVKMARRQREHDGITIGKLAVKYGVSPLTMRDAINGYGAYRDV